jgi:aerobic carbon-monoxide dehydrogenase medium subunit
MILPRFEYTAVSTPEEAISLIAGYEGQAEFIAGGTDIMVNMKRRIVHPDLLVSIHKLDQLRGFDQRSKNQFRIGVLNSMHDIAASDKITKHFSALAAAAGGMGSPQIRNRATIGGNLVSSRPAADTIGPLIGYGAQVRLQGLKDERLVPMESFCTGPGECVLFDNEIMTDILLEIPRRNTHGVYLKFGTRKSMEISIVSVTTILTLDDGGLCQKARIVLGAVAPTFIRAPEAESLLQGKRLSENLASQAGELAQQSCNPITDTRASAEYRRMLVRALTRKSILQIATLT